MHDAVFSLTSQLVMSRQVLDITGDIYDVPVDQAAGQAFEIYWSGVSVRSVR